MSSNLLNKLMRLKDKLYEGNVNNPLDRLRLYTYVVSTLLVILGVALHFLGILGVVRPTLLAISFCWACADAILLAVFLARQLKLRTAFVLSGIVAQLVETVRIFYLFSTQTVTSQQFYLNEFISFSILLLVVMGFFYKTALLLTVINLLTIIICRVCIPEMVDTMTISFFVLVDIALCVYCFASVAFAKQITVENEEVKGKYNTFLSFMRMNDTEVTSLIKLVRSAFDDGKHIDTLVGQLKDETKANIINVASHIRNSQLAKEEKIKKHFPHLSPTELAVCRLVVRGHSQKDIARIMDKSENNISTVRGNIRRKLNLETSQNLREYLMNTIE